MLLAKLRVEGDRSPADVLLTNYVGVLEQARGQGLLTAVTSSKVQDIPAEVRACLYVLADFGAVAILRYSTFTRAVYVQMTGRYDLTGAAALSLVLVGLSLMFFLAERYCRRRSRWSCVALWAWCLSSFVPAFGVAVTYVGIESLTHIRQGALNWEFWRYARNSMVGSAVAATLAVTCALPLAYVALRRPSPAHRTLLHAAYAGYVLPGPIVALGLIFCTVHLLTPIYGTVAVLVLACIP